MPIMLHVEQLSALIIYILQKIHPFISLLHWPMASPEEKACYWLLAHAQHYCKMSYNTEFILDKEYTDRAIIAS